MSAGRDLQVFDDEVQRYWNWRKRRIVAEITERVLGENDLSETSSRLSKRAMDGLGDAFGVKLDSEYKRPKRKMLREIHPELDESKGKARFDKPECRELLASLDRGDTFDAD